MSSINIPEAATAGVAVGTLIWSILRDRKTDKTTQSDKDQAMTSASLKRALDGLSALADSLQKEIDRLLLQRDDLEKQWQTREAALLAEILSLRNEIIQLKDDLTKCLGRSTPPAAPAGP